MSGDVDGPGAAATARGQDTTQKGKEAVTEVNTTRLRHLVNEVTEREIVYLREKVAALRAENRGLRLALGQVQRDAE